MPDGHPITERSSGDLPAADARAASSAATGFSLENLVQGLRKDVHQNVENSKRKLGLTPDAARSKSPFDAQRSSSGHLV